MMIHPNVRQAVSDVGLGGGGEICSAEAERVVTVLD